MKYIKILYDEHVGEATRVEYPNKIEGKVISRREAIQNISEFISCLKDYIFPSPVRKGRDCWYVTLHKYEEEDR